MSLDGWQAVIGLEVHCELKTATKLFCGCPNAFGSEPNTSVCPVCLGLPGSLPVLNRHAVELAMRIGQALHCDIRPSIFHRKNYFYPDMPKDYQISQYDSPINVGGWLDLPDGSRVGIVRAHLEEDTGKTTHVGGGGRIDQAYYSLVDYNRAGVPLVEIVSAPDIFSAEQARLYVSELRGILVATGASDGKMEEGSLRVDANISVRPRGSAEFGTRCEVKNLNSLRSLARAIDHEVARQVRLLESGEQVMQETRHWDEASGVTSALRSKEQAHDYRYFPEPDLVPLDPDPEWRRQVAASLPPLPAERRRTLAGLLGEAELSEALVAQVSTLVELDLDTLVVAAVREGADARIALNRAANELAADPAGGRRLDPRAFAKLVSMEASGALSATQSKEVLAELVATGEDPEAVAKRRGFESLSDEALSAAIEEAIAANPKEWERFCAGEQQLAGLFIGQVRKATGGKANGKVVKAMLDQRRGRVAFGCD